MPQSPPPPNAGIDTPLGELSSPELGDWESPTATMTSSAPYGLLEQEPTEPEKLERRSAPTEPLATEPPTPSMPPLRQQTPSPSPSPSNQAAPEPPPPTAPEHSASTAPAAAQLASWAPPAPSSSAPAPISPIEPAAADQASPGSPSWAALKASPKPETDSDNGSDPLEGWDPSAPFDASSPIGLGNAEAPSSDAATPFGQQASPPPPNTATTGEPSFDPQSLASMGDQNAQLSPSSTPFDSSTFEATTAKSFPPGNQMANDANGAGNPMKAGVNAENESLIDNGIDTGRVIAMALLGGFALLVFLVLLASLF